MTMTRRTLEDGSLAIARTLPGDQPSPLGTNLISARVWARYGPEGTSTRGLTLPELWGMVEDAMAPDEYGWRPLDDDWDGIAYFLAPHPLGGLTLFDGFELLERIAA